MLWGGRGASPTRLRGNRALSVCTQTPMDEESSGSCGCAVTPRSFLRRLRETSGPALLSQYAGAGQEGGAPGLQTNASAAARWGVPPHRGCAGARPPAVTAVARGERRSPGACAGGFAGARGKFAPSARQPGRRRRRRREAEPGDHPPSPSPPVTSRTTTSPNLSPPPPIPLTPGWQRPPAFPAGPAVASAGFSLWD